MDFPSPIPGNYQISAYHILVLDVNWEALNESATELSSITGYDVSN